VGQAAVKALNQDLATASLDDDHDNDTLSAAAVLAPQSAVAGPITDASASGAIDDASDADVYQVTAPSFGSSQNRVLVATVWSTENRAEVPRLAVFNAQGQQLNGELLVNDGLTTSLQVSGVVADQAYFIKVLGADSGSRPSGAYELSVDFRTNPLNVQRFVGGAFDQAQQQATNLTVTQTQLFQLRLSAALSGTATGSASVMMIITNSSNRIVAQLTASAGSSVSADLVLTPDTYVVHFIGLAATTSDLQQLHFDLTGLSRSDPIGLEPVDTTLKPVGGSTAVTGYTWGQMVVDTWTFLGLDGILSDTWWR